MEKDAKQIKNRIGVVLDDGCFYDELSLSEMKSIISSAYTTWSEQDFKRYMDMFSLEPRQKISTLSKGMKMKYALALALSHNAELLIMDEPTSGLCKEQMMTIIKYLQKMKNEGKTVIVITHDYELIDECGGVIYEFLNKR